MRRASHSRRTGGQAPADPFHDLASVIAATSEAISGIDLDGTVEIWNPAAERVFGYSALEMIGRSLSLLHPRELQLQFQQALRQVATGASVEIAQTERMHRDGRRVQVSVSMLPRRDRKGRIIGAAKIVRDVTSRWEAERTLRDSEARFRAIAETANDAILLVDDGGRIVYCNPATDLTFGYRAGELLGRPVTVLVPDWVAQVGKTLEREGVRSDGTRFPLHISLATWQAVGRACCAAILHDVTELAGAIRALQRETNLVRLLQTVAVTANQANSARLALQNSLAVVCAHTGWSIGRAFLTQPGAAPVLQCVSSWHTESIAALFDPADRPGTMPSSHLPEQVQRSGQAAWIADVSADPVLGPSEFVRATGVRTAFAFPLVIGDEAAGALEFLSLAGNLPDAEMLRVMGLIGHQLGRVVERERAATALQEAGRMLERRVEERTQDLAQANLRLQSLNSRLDELANVDSLTSLLNRRGLQRALDRELSRAARDGSDTIAMLLDLDDFKAINSRLGHAVGDAILEHVAARIRQALRKTDCAARIGGDEFMVFLPQTRRAEGLIVAEKIREAIGGSPVLHAEQRVTVTPSLAVVEAGDGAGSIDELLGRMHPLLSRSKSFGKNRVSHGWQDPAGAGAARGTEPDLVARLQDPASYRAVAQPILRLRDGATVAYEFFGRTRIDGLAMPDLFFRAAQQAEMLTLVDRHCFRAGVTAASNLCAGRRCHVNLFPSTLHSVPVDQLVADLPHGLGSSDVCIEISEQQIVGDPSHLVAETAALRRAGFSIALDDVGFGRTSLESLILLEPDVIKVDGRWINGIARNPSLARSLERLVRVAAQLGAVVIAEGVEDRADAVALVEIGIEHAQGFLWADPDRDESSRRD